MSGHLMYDFPIKATYLLGHVCTYSDLIFNEHYNVPVLWNFGFDSNINLQKLTGHWTNLENFILWGGMLCSCLYGLVSLFKSYLRLYFVGFVLCIRGLLSKCKKWQQTCFCCSFNLWLLKGTRYVLLYHYNRHSDWK
jgi:hypothetical protein